MYSQFRIRYAKQLQKKINDKLNKYMYANTNNDNELIDVAITLAEDERTIIDKNEKTNVYRVTIDAAQAVTDKTKTTIRQRGRNVGNAIITDTRRLINRIKRDGKHVQFRYKPTITTLYNNDNATMLTYDSGANGH